MLLEKNQAFYAPRQDAQIIVDFCNQCAVDFLIVDETSFSPELIGIAQSTFEGTYLADFFNSLNNDKDFSLAHTPQELRLFQSGNYLIASCDERLLGENGETVAE